MAGEENAMTKPVLSFGISSILAASKHQRLLPISSYRNSKRSQSAFRSVNTKSKSSVDEGTVNSNGNRTTSTGIECQSSTDSANKCQQIGDHVTECHISREPAVKCLRTNCMKTIDSRHASNIKFGRVDDLAAGLPESLLQHSSESSMKCQPTPPILLSAASFPIVPQFSTQNYFLTSLEKFRPKNYNEYRKVGHPYSNRTPPKRKKPRTTFNREQIAELEARFLGQKYLASTERLRLAKHLHLTDSQVKTWFQNRRTKWRRQTAEEREAERNAATKYIMKMQQSAAIVHAANAAAIWPSLMSAHAPTAPMPTSTALQT